MIPELTEITWLRSWILRIKQSDGSAQMTEENFKGHTVLFYTLTSPPQFWHISMSLNCVYHYLSKRDKDSTVYFEEAFGNCSKPKSLPWHRVGNHALWREEELFFQWLNNFYSWNSSLWEGSHNLLFHFSIRQMPKPEATQMVTHNHTSHCSVLWIVWGF